MSDDDKQFDTEAEQLRRALAGRRPVDPGVGFETRATAGGLARAHARRRRQLWATGLFATAAATAAIVFVATREPAPRGETARAPEPGDPTGVASPASPTSDVPDVLVARELVKFSDLDRNLYLEASWERVLEPVGEYGLLAPDLMGGWR